MEYIFVFQNTHDAIYAEKLLKNASIPVRVMALPSQIARGCGICLRLYPQHDMQAESILIKKNIFLLAVYLSFKKNGKAYFKICKRFFPASH